MNIRRMRSHPGQGSVRKLRLQWNRSTAEHAKPISGQGGKNRLPFFPPQCSPSAAQSIATAASFNQGAKAQGRCNEARVAGGPVMDDAPEPQEATDPLCANQTTSANHFSDRA